MVATQIPTKDIESTVNFEVVQENQVTEQVPYLTFKYKRKPIYHFFKRIADIVLSIFALVILSPLLLAVSAIIISKDPGSPFFVQERVGKNGKIFKMIKFRSMYKDAEERKNDLMEANEDKSGLFKIKDDPRILGKLGSFIRKYSIDELPQLLNILKGDMSIIGPRPFIPNEQGVKCEERILVKPGLSCYWQIYGKNDLSVEMSNYYDKKYIMDRSISVDALIIFKTFGVVLKSKNS